MFNPRPYLTGVLVILASTPFLFAADNGVQVENLTNDQPKVVPFQAPVDADKSQPAQSGGEMAYQVQVLQQDTRDLRGMVEDLQHQIKQIQKTQESRYLDLDKRIQNLQQQLAKLAAANAAAANTGEIADVNNEEPISSGSASEKAQYEKALNMIRKRQYEPAITQLQSVISQYPNGDYTANAYYWMGEVYAALPKPDYDKSRQALAQVITYFPKSRKVPDAMYKLGKVYFLMGDCKRARQTLEKVVNDYKGKAVANLAAAFLRDNVHCKD